MRATAATPEENLGVEIGSVLVGKYRVDAVLGQGGMGVVARGTDLHLNEPIAIKFLRADIAGDREATTRFVREAQAAFKLKGEHVARVLHVGQTDDEIPYLVMEFLDGVDLDGMLEQSARVAPPLAVDFIVQACEGLAEAHSLGIVHRDVKPSNFFVTWRADGTPLVKLLDFGISKVANTTDVSLTQTQSMLGTPAYMSPEQMRSARTVDARSDIWSLGAVLYELCEGTRPFEAESFSEMCVKVAVDPPAPMTTPMPPGLEAVIVRCLEKKPEARYATVAAVAEALAPFARDPRAAAVAVQRIDRLVGRTAPGRDGGFEQPGSSPAIAIPSGVLDGKSTPVPSSPIPKTLVGTALPASAAATPVGTTSGEYNPYPPKKTTPWASGGAMPPPQAPPPAPPVGSSPAIALPPMAAPGSQAQWVTPPSSPAIAPVAGRSSPGLSVDTINDTLRGPRTTGSIRTPRRVAVIALVAALVVIAAMVGVAVLGGGVKSKAAPTGSGSEIENASGQPAAESDTGSGSGSDTGSGSGSASGSDTGSGSGSGSDTGSGSAAGSDTASGSGSAAGTGSASRAAGAGSGAHEGAVRPSGGSGKPSGKRNGKRNGKRDDDDIYGRRH